MNGKLKSSFKISQLLIVSSSSSCYLLIQNVSSFVIKNSVSLYKVFHSIELIINYFLLNIDLYLNAIYSQITEYLGANVQYGMIAFLKFITV